MDFKTMTFFNNFLYNLVNLIEQVKTAIKTRVIGGGQPTISPAVQKDLKEEQDNWKERVFQNVGKKKPAPKRRQRRQEETKVTVSYTPTTPTVSVVGVKDEPKKNRSSKKKRS